MSSYQLITCSTLIEGAEAETDEEALAAADDAAEEEAADTAAADHGPAATTATAPVTASRANAVAAAPRGATSPARTRAREVTFAAAVNSAQSIYASSRSYHQAIAELNRPTINAALTDVTRTATVSMFPRTPLSELWTPVLDQSAILQFICNRLPLTDYRISDWVWSDRPSVSDYTGDKADIPSDTMGIAAVDLVAKSLAGGHDVDRAHIDFNTGFRESYFRVMMQSLANALTQKAIAAVVMASGAKPGNSAGVFSSFGSAFIGAAGVTMDAGGNVDYILADADAWSDWANTPAVDVPLAGIGSIVDVTRGGIDQLAPGQIPLIRVANGMGSGTVITGDKRALNVWTTEGIQAEAVNVPQGGVDLGLFSYYQTYMSAPTTIGIGTISNG